MMGFSSSSAFSLMVVAVVVVVAAAAADGPACDGGATEASAAGDSAAAVGETVPACCIATAGTLLEGGCGSCAISISISATAAALRSLRNVLPPSRLLRIRRPVVARASASAVTACWLCITRIRNRWLGVSSGGRHPNGFNNRGNKCYRYALSKVLTFVSVGCCSGLRGKRRGNDQLLSRRCFVECCC